MAVSINMAKARDVHRGKMRDARAGKFVDLDTQFIRAIETGTDTKTIVAAKQALRDATKHPDIEAAQTIDELKKVWPDCLKG